MRLGLTMLKLTWSSFFSASDTYSVVNALVFPVRVSHIPRSSSQYWNHCHHLNKKENTIISKLIIEKDVYLPETFCVEIGWRQSAETCIGIPDTLSGGEGAIKAVKRLAVCLSVEGVQAPLEIITRVICEANLSLFIENKAVCKISDVGRLYPIPHN